MSETSSGGSVYPPGWDLTELYKTPEACRREAQITGAHARSFHIPDVLHADPNEVAALLDARSRLVQALGRTAFYEQERQFLMQVLPGDALTQTVAIVRSQVEALASDVDQRVSDLPDDALAALGKTPRLDGYRHTLDDLRRKKRYRQSVDVERELVVLEGKERQVATAGMYSVITRRVGECTPHVKNVRDEWVDATAGMYGQSDRSVRAHAYDAVHAGLHEQRDALAELYSSKIAADNRASVLRGFDSALEARLFKDNIPVEVYTQVIEAMHADGIPLLHEYQRLRQRVLGLETLRMYDVVAPFTSGRMQRMTFEQAASTAKGALSRLGEETAVLFDHALDNRWVDAYAAEGKRKGSRTDFTPGAPHPFVLLNMAPDNADAYTLVHEFGHAQHMYASRDLAPHEAYPDEFTSETVAQCNEHLLTEHLLQTAVTSEERIPLLAQSLDVLHRGLMRQVMFAEFEQRAYAAAQAGVPLDAEVLENIYTQVNVEYYGQVVAVDEKIGSEYGRLGNFYNQQGFYVYQYATGMAAGVALAEQILHGGQDGIQRHLQLLSSGRSDYAMELLKRAGVDMASGTPIRHVFKLFKTRLDELTHLLDTTGTSA